MMPRHTRSLHPCGVELKALPFSSFSSSSSSMPTLPFPPEVKKKVKSQRKAINLKSREGLRTSLEGR
ncbi:hypothetical protein E2C01_032465 [Portunus trituberculatus]|uniref:Uncharacterized protein n=1 Tax=Portunus trituberculatus TaxID=210409 RepID=A0A5B7F0C5_PORTR|nr:hypothetical protein [Portunus trituberculatus]